MNVKLLAEGRQINRIAMVIAVCICLPVGIITGIMAKKRKRICPDCGRGTSRHGCVCPECGYYYQADARGKETTTGERFDHKLEKIEELAVDKIMAFGGNVEEFLKNKGGNRT